MTTDNRRRDLLAQVDAAFEGKMYLCISGIAKKLGFNRHWLAKALEADGVPRRKRGNRVECTQRDIRDWLIQQEIAS